MSAWHDGTKLVCDTCPFSSADPDAILGHEKGPSGGRGWLGNGEVHRMWHPTSRASEYWDEAMPDRRQGERRQRQLGSWGLAGDTQYGGALYQQQFEVEWPLAINRHTGEVVALQQEIKGEFRMPGDPDYPVVVFTRSWARRALEWASRWLGHYVR